MKRLDFPHWALGIAQAVSERSEDPYVRVGAVVLRDDWTIVGVGYNGLPAGITMSDEWWHDRNGRRPFMIHAEVNALRWATPANGLMLVSTHIPCASCLPLIGSFGIALVYWQHQLGEAHDLDAIRIVAETMGIQLVRIGETHG